jgi:uncharacterized protein (UPF0212 family)
MSQAEEQTDDYLVKYSTMEHVQDFTNDEECQERALEEVRDRLEDAGLDHLETRVGRKRCSADDCAEIHADMMVAAGNGFVRVIIEGNVYNAKDEEHAKSAMDQTLAEAINDLPRAHLSTQPVSENDDSVGAS